MRHVARKPLGAPPLERLEAGEVVALGKYAPATETHRPSGRANPQGLVRTGPGALSRAARNSGDELMSRMPADQTARLEQWRAARKAIGRRKKVRLNAEELAKLLGWTWRYLRQRIDADQDFPVEQRGNMGVPWQFDAAAVLDHLIALASRALQERERRTAEVSRLAGLGGTVVHSPGDNPAGPGSAARDMLERARAISALLDVQARVRSDKQRLGRLVDVDAAKAVLWEMMTTMQTETLAVSAKLDPAGQWEPSLRAGVDEALRNVLVHVRDKLDEKLGKLGGPPG